MTTIVISQPMFFPWPGIFEQMRLADIFVHYDDVQLPQGRSFTSRVQIKTAQGVQWLTVPVRRLGRNINEAALDEGRKWRETHLKTLKHAYARAPFREDMINIVQEVYDADVANLADLNCRAIEALARYLGFEKTFRRSSSLEIGYTSSLRLLKIVQALGGDVYVTGHGARNYLDHELFERNGIRVEYMRYELNAYPQLHSEFTPYISVLDTVANLGPRTPEVIKSQSIPWRMFLSG